MRTLLALGLVASVSACATPYTVMPASHPNDNYEAAYRATHGRIASMEQVDESGRPSGAGAVIGGVAGGVVGHQFGHGSGKDAATILGVIGGALAGNEIERNNTAPRPGYRMVIRMDDGRSRDYAVASIGDLRVGERVRIDHNQIVRD